MTTATRLHPAWPRALRSPDFRLPVPGADDPAEAAFVRAAGHAARLLPATVHDALVDFADDPGPAGALLLRNMPVGEVPPTPESPIARSGKDLESEFTLLVVARRLGQPVGYAQEHGGGLVQNILPVSASAGRQVSTSSDTRLEWHTETAFHPHKPRYLLLLCLRGDPDAATQLCSIEAVLPRLDDRTVEVLRAPRFRTLPDESFLAPGNQGVPSDPLAVLTGDPQRPAVTWDEMLMTGVDREASDALRCFGDAVAASSIDLVLDRGDLLVVDNHRALHGRAPFRARYDGFDRWLQRTFVVSDLSASAAERTGRIVTTQF